MLKDCGGKIMTDSGPVSLDKGSIHFLKRYALCLLPRCVCCLVVYYYVASAFKMTLYFIRTIVIYLSISGKCNRTHWLMRALLLLLLLNNHRSDVEQFVREGLVEHVLNDGQC